MILLVLSALTALGVSLFRITADITYHPIVLEAETPMATQPLHHLNLNDDLVIEQTFIAPATAFSHVALGIANFRSAPSTARLTVTIQQGVTVLATNSLGVGQLRTQDITHIALAADLIPHQPYTIVLHTTGVSAQQSLTVSYEIDDTAFPQGDVAQTKTDMSSQKRLPGNIRFSLLQLPTRSIILSHLLSSPLFWISLLYLVIVVTIVSVRPMRTMVYSYLFYPIPSLSVGSVSIRYILILTLLGTALSAYVTLPYYTASSLGATPIDLQRALVYRAVARDAMLSNHSIALWEPYLCGGTTLIGNMESVHFDPFFLLVLFFGEDMGLRLSTTLTFILGFVGASVLARRFFNVHPVAAPIAGLVFVFSGFQMLAFSEYFFAWLPVSWIPWFFLSLGESIRRPWFVIPSSIFLSFIILGGSIHMLVFSVGASFLCMLVVALFSRHPQPLLVWGLALALTLPLVAIKMIPVMATQAITTTFERTPSFIPPLSWLPTMFLSRGQVAIEELMNPATGEPIHWLEYGSYLGFLTPLFLFSAVVFVKRTKLWYATVITALVLLAMVFGYFPWTILHTLPVTNEILRDPSRIRGIAVLFIGLLAAAGWSYLITHVFTRGKILIGSLGVLILTLDLLSLHAPLFRDQFLVSFPRPRPHAVFSRINEAYALGLPGYYEVYRNNQGTTDQCFNQLKVVSGNTRGTNSSDETRPYRGEVFFLHSAGTAAMDTFTPDRITVNLTPTTDDWLVLNTNYLPGWKTIPPREVTAQDGLIAARVSPNDKSLTFVYEPLAYRVGKIITSVSLIILVGLGAHEWYSRKKTLSE